MAYGVIYDACILHPAPLRDLLIGLAAADTVRARWTDAILDECFASIVRTRPDLLPEKLERTRRLMVEAVPDCLVTGYEGLIPSLKLPDPNDCHVLAAAIRANAQAIVTFNLKDFPSSVLEEFTIEAIHPDDFIVNTIDLAQGAVVQVITEQVARCRAPPMTIPHLLDKLREQRLSQSVARLRGLWPPAV